MPPKEIDGCRPLIVADRICTLPADQVAALQTAGYLLDEKDQGKIKRPQHRKGESVQAKHAMLGEISGTTITVELLGNGLRISLPTAMIEPLHAVPVLDEAAK